MPVMQSKIALNPRRKAIAEINVVPYIDVMLVLLVVFMVTAPLLTQGIALELPKVQAQALPNADTPVTVSISQDGRYHLTIGGDDHQALMLSVILTQLSSILTEVPNTLIMVEADTQVSYGKVMQLISGLKRIEASNVGFVTDPAGARDPLIEES